MRFSIERSPAIETLTSLGGSISPEGRGDLPKPKSHKRSYKAGQMRRTDKDFLWSGQSQLPHVYRNLRNLRGRSRELARNNAWFIKFLRMCRRNVIGPDGMRIESAAYTRRGDKLDQPLNALVDQHWTAWRHPENASANQRMSWLDLQLYWMTTLARDGEVMFRKIYPDRNPYEFALKPIDVAWLDETYNETRPNGNRIIMSVEVDSNDRHVAYWLTPPADAYYGGIQPTIRQRTQVSAEDIYFHFIPFDQNCSDTVVTRGIPWAHAAMLNLWSLGAFEESAIIAARIGASKMGFFKNRPGDPLTLTKDELAKAADGQGPDEDDEDDDPLLFDHVEPGQFGDIGDKDFTPFDPKYPSDMVKPFNSAMLHGIAAGLGPEYFSFASDLTEVNFSAGRIGLGEERDNWMAIQGFGIEHLVRPVRLDWQKSGALTGAIPIGPDDLKRLTEPKVNGRRWGYYDPKVDVDADEKKLALGLTSRRRILAEQSGPDFEEILEDLQNEEDLADEAEIDISPAKGGASQPGQQQKPADPNDPSGDTAGD